MYAFATWLGGNRYDVVVWQDEPTSHNDNGAKAVDRQVVTADPACPSESIRAALGLTDTDDINLN